MPHNDVEPEELEPFYGDAEEEWEGARYTLKKQNRQRLQRTVGKPSLLDLEDEEPLARPAAKRQRPNQPETFRCRHCRMMVEPVPSGGKHRNHCPYCLHSRHVDQRMPGDRLSPCGGTMAPIGSFEQRNGEYSIIHRCLACGVERRNRIAADDDFEAVLALPDMTDWQETGEMGL